MVFNTPSACGGEIHYKIFLAYFLCNDRGNIRADISAMWMYISANHLPF